MMRQRDNTDYLRCELLRSPIIFIQSNEDFLFKLHATCRDTSIILKTCNITEVDEFNEALNNLAIVSAPCFKQKFDLHMQQKRRQVENVMFLLKQFLTKTKRFYLLHLLWWLSLTRSI